MLFNPTKPYFSFSQYLQQRYGEKVWKISVDAGFSCPNRDGSKGYKGCIFCRLDSFSKMASLDGIDIKTQIQAGIHSGRERFGIRKFIVYFQASTNTYAPIDILREYCECALSFPGIVGISLATRPDCLPDPVLHHIEELSRRTDVWVELGLQSSHDATLKAINRGHTYTDYLQAIEKLKNLNVRICTHIMFGLPGESSLHMQQTAERIAHSHIAEIKLHPLLILRGTGLEALYEDKRVKALELEEYAKLVCDFIERMPPSMIIQRLTAEAPQQLLLAPLWALKKDKVLNEIKQEFHRRNSFQGVRYT